MPSLIERVRAATGPDRELDAAIMFDFFAQPAGKHDDDGGPRGYLWPEDDPSWNFGMRFPGKDRAWFESRREHHDETLLINRDGALVLMNSLRVPPLSASLDAAIALVERVLPGWSRDIAWCCDLKLSVARLVKGPMREDTAGCPTGSAPTEPLALLLALLHAIENKEENGG